MSKASADTDRIKELEQALAEAALTVAAQADELVSQLNTNLALRRDIKILQAANNGSNSDE